MFSIDDIYLYIFCWNKVVDNSCQLYTEISVVCPNTTIINCDEKKPLDPDKYRSIQLDDSYYYGGQFETAIKATPTGRVFACITGDVLPGANWQEIMENTLKYMNRGDVGIIAPNISVTYWNKRQNHIIDELWAVENTDCTFWFINPVIVSELRNLQYKTLSNYGWGIDRIFISESKLKNMLVVRDYSQIIHQPPGTGYNLKEADVQMYKLINSYNEYKEQNTN
jgi:hypothetical protein